jgi:hypothetical protein
MNKVLTYKNYNEYIKNVFPNVYKEKKYSNEISLDTIIRNISDDFKAEINNILTNNQKPNGT